jgi:hypothetical protein
MIDVSELRQTLISLKLTGELNRNTPEANRQAVREMLAQNDYWELEAERITGLRLGYDEVVALVASNLGMTPERFESDEAPFIDPEHTVSRFITGYHRLERVAKAGGKILFSTAHPGSLLSFYQCLSQHFASLGAQVIRLDEPVAAPENRWLDDVNGVIVLSDEGNLMHTHASHGMRELIARSQPDIVMSDHAFAIAAMNLNIPTVAIFDVDDPAIPVMAHLEPERMIAIPMNDNQTNTRSARAAHCLIETMAHDRNPQHIHSRTVGSA